jgi:hypothetical protein
LHHTLLLRSDGDVVAFGANFDGQCNIPKLTPGGPRYVAPIAHSYVVVTLMMREEASQNCGGYGPSSVSAPSSVSTTANAPNGHIIACVSMSGEDLAVISVDPKSTLLSGVRVALAKRLKLPLWRLRFVLPDAHLLTETDDCRCVGEFFSSTNSPGKTQANHLSLPNFDYSDSVPATPIAVTAR